MTGLLVEIALSFVLLFGGALLLARGLTRLGRTFHLRPAVIGVTLAPLGLLSAAMMVAFQAGAGGSPEMALGMALGIPPFCLLAALGLSALWHPLRTASPRMLKDCAALAGASALVAAMLWDTTISRAEGLMLMLLGLAYGVYCVSHARKQPLAEEEGKKRCSAFCAVAFVFTGLAMIATGGNLLIDGSISAGLVFGLPESSMGAALAAMVAASPALLPALRHGGAAAALMLPLSTHALLTVLGLGAVMASLPASLPLLAFDRWFLLATCGFVAALVVLPRRISRPAGAVFLALYAVYALYHWQILA